MNVKIEPSWKKILEPEFKKPYFKTLAHFVKQEYNSHQVYPPPKLIFNAFNTTPFNKVKVVILGQDPYHGRNQAHGLCFSVPDKIAPPPSLQNIYKEIEADTGTKPEPVGDLERWARQGVLLLNSTLTVQAHKAGSHQKRGWEEFTDTVIKILSVMLFAWLPKVSSLFT